jgi:hypothetical protein
LDFSLHKNLSTFDLFHFQIEAMSRIAHANLPSTDLVTNQYHASLSVKGSDFKINSDFLHNISESLSIF